MCYFMSEFYQQQAISPVASRENRGYSAVTVERRTAVACAVYTTSVLEVATNRKKKKATMIAARM